MEEEVKQMELLARKKELEKVVAVDNEDVGDAADLTGGIDTDKLM